MSLGYALDRVHNKLKKYNNTSRNKDNLTTKSNSKIFYSEYFNSL